MPQLEEDINVSHLFWSDWWKRVLVMSDTRNVHSALSLSERTPLLFSLLPFPFLFSLLLSSPLLFFTLHTLLSSPLLSMVYGHIRFCQSHLWAVRVWMCMHLGGSEWGGILGLLILHTPLVKLNMKMKVRGERECVRVGVCMEDSRRVKGEEPCLILWDARVSAVWRWAVEMCSVVHGSQNLPNWQKRLSRDRCQTANCQKKKKANLWNIIVHIASYMWYFRGISDLFFFHLKFCLKKKELWSQIEKT